MNRFNLRRIGLLTVFVLMGGSALTTPIFPVLTLNTHALRGGVPKVRVIPERVLRDMGVTQPAYLESSFFSSVLFPASSLRDPQYLKSLSSPTTVVIRVYSVAQLLKPKANLGRSYYLEEIENLRTINAGQLALSTLSATVGPVTEPSETKPSLPYLMPLWGTFQVVAGAAERINLQSGIQGLRYLAVRSADVGYYSAESVQYIYQGLSADGRFYVTMTAPFLPKGVPTAAQIKASYSYKPTDTDATFVPYTLELKKRLEGSRSSPILQKLDTVLRSIALK